MALNEHGNDSDVMDARIARLYRESAREEPPSRIDRAIAHAAREPARPGTSRATRRWIAWRLPFAVAAVSVVSVSLVVLMLDERREMIEPPSMSAPLPAREAPVQDESEVPGARPPGRDAVTQKPREPDLRSPFPAPAPQAAAQSGKVTAAPSQAQDEARLRGQSDRETREGRAVQAPREGSTEGALDRRAPAPASPAPSGPAEAGKPSGDSAAHAPEAKRAPANMSPRSDVGARLEREPAPGARARKALSTEAERLEGEPAAAWVERALELRRMGRGAEAEALVAEIRKRFPGVGLPPELE